VVVYMPSYLSPLTGSEGLQGCETLRISHCLDNSLTDGGKVVSPMHRPETYFSASGIHFCYEESCLLGYNPSVV
jgi:hypothetical protein